MNVSIFVSRSGLTFLYRHVAGRLFIGMVLITACCPAILEAATLRPVPEANVHTDTTLQQARLSGWHQFVHRNQYVSLPQKLQRVNTYLNQFEYRSDNPARKGGDAWATPYEFLVHNGGDCEDFAIAKYFLLRSLGVPEERLQITYVYHLKRKQYHMVLLYQPSGHGKLLVLDNLTNVVMPLAARHEIEPVYGFNQHHVWVVGKTAHRTQVGGADRLSRWKALLGRMRQQPLGEVTLISG